MEISRTRQIDACYQLKLVANPYYTWLADAGWCCLTAWLADSQPTHIVNDAFIFFVLVFLWYLLLSSSLCSLAKLKHFRCEPIHPRRKGVDCLWSSAHTLILQWIDRSHQLRSPFLQHCYSQLSLIFIVCRSPCLPEIDVLRIHP